MPAEVAHAPNARGTRVASGAVRAVSVVAAVVAVVSSAAFIVLAADRVPFSNYNVTTTDWLLVFVVSGYALAIAGLAWLIALVAAWRKRHLRTRWLAAPPALLAVGVLAAVAIGLAISEGFDESRPELDAVAAQARSHPPGWSENYGYDDPRHVGNMDVGSVLHREDGVVVVSNADSGLFFQMSGWAHSPEGPPTFDPGVRGLEVNHLEGPWYSYRYVL